MTSYKADMFYGGCWLKRGTEKNKGSISKTPFALRMKSYVKRQTLMPKKVSQKYGIELQP